MSVHLCFECNDEIKLTTSHSCIRGLKKGIDRVLMEIQNDYDRRFKDQEKIIKSILSGNINCADKGKYLEARIDALEDKQHNPSRAKLEASLAEKNKEIGELRKTIDVQYASVQYWYNQASLWKNKYEKAIKRQCDGTCQLNPLANPVPTQGCCL